MHTSEMGLRGILQITLSELLCLFLHCRRGGNTVVIMAIAASRIFHKDNNLQFVLRQRSDAFVNMARKDGYVCRSAYKLLEIDDKYHILSKAKGAVVDLGSAPGSWCQVIRKRVDSDCLVYGVDLLPLHTRLSGVEFLQGDFSSLKAQSTLKEALERRGVAGSLDVVVSDMCPTRGAGGSEKALAATLNRNACIFALNNLHTGGHFVCKLLGGESLYPELLELANRWFTKVHRVRPAATRQTSDESFLVALRKLEVPRQVGDIPKALLGEKLRPQIGTFGLDDWPGLHRRR